MTTITTRTNLGAELSFAQGDANLDRDMITAAADPAQTDGSDNRSVYECNGTFDVTLPEASVIVDAGATKPWNDYGVTIKNVGTGVITVKTSGTDTLDGVVASGDRIVAAGASFTYKVNSGKTGYVSVFSVPISTSILTAYSGSATTGSTVLAGATGYIQATGLGWSWAASEGGATDVLIPVSGDIKSFFIWINENNASSSSVLTLLKAPKADPQNYSDTNVIVTITAGSTAIFDSGALTDTIVAGDSLKIKIVAGTGGSIKGGIWGFSIHENENTS